MIRSGVETGALALARDLVNRYGWNATAYQILNPGIERWFSARHDAVVGFVTFRGYRVVAGEPICPSEQLTEVVAEFEDATHEHGLWSCYFAADDRLARLLARRGPLDRILLGAQPVWRLGSWPSVVERKASLRAQLNRARNKGVVVERWPIDRAANHPRLRRCLEEWLDTRGLPPLHFLVEPETLGRLDGRRIFVAEQGGEALAFLVASPVPLRRGWLIEQTVRGAAAPNGTSELLLDAAMRDLSVTGAEYVTLGLSPLSRRAALPQSSQRLWLRALLAWVRAHGRRFYNFDGLDAYKAKFLPETWEPIYAITSERRIGFGTLYAIAGAFGRMSPLLLMSRAMGRAVRKESQWLAKGFRRRLMSALAPSKGPAPGPGSDARGF